VYILYPGSTYRSKLDSLSVDHLPNSNLERSTIVLLIPSRQIEKLQNKVGHDLLLVIPYGSTRRQENAFLLSSSNRIRNVETTIFRPPGNSQGADSLTLNDRGSSHTILAVGMLSSRLIFPANLLGVLLHVRARQIPDAKWHINFCRIIFFSLLLFIFF